MSDDGRHALTLIAMVGSVFSPFYAKARAGSPEADPREHCTMNVALYGPRGVRWAMTERGRESLRTSPDGVSIGPSSLAWEGDSLVVRFDERSSPFPSVVPERLSGTVRLHPAALTGASHALDAEGLHRWWPVAPVARVEVELDHPSLRWKGTAYHDANAGAGSLEGAFQGWHWSRAHEPGGQGARVLYEVVDRAGERSALSLRFDREGRAEPVTAPPRATLPTTRWGIERATRCDRSASPRVTRTLEDTPFYARSLIETTLSGRRVEAVHESLDLDRFASSWVQFLLPFRMRRV